jgi:hypothetical protein
MTCILMILTISVKLSNRYYEMYQKWYQMSLSFYQKNMINSLYKLLYNK